MGREIYQKFLPDQDTKNQQPRPAPEIILWQFLGDPHIRERLVHTPKGDHSVRHKAERAIKTLNRHDSAITAKKLVDIAKHPQSSKELKAGAIILFNNISQEKRKPLSKKEQSKKRQKKLLELIKENPEATNEQLAKELQCSVTSVKKAKRALRDEGTFIPSKTGRPRSAEHQAKLNEANRGRRHSAETKAKMSASQKGKPKSAEHRAKISEAKRRRRAQK